MKKRFCFNQHGAEFLGTIKTRNPVSKLPKNASSHDGKPTGLVFRDGNRGAESAAQADRMLARYPADVREQITELLRVLAEKPGDAEKLSSVA
jgi:hypothetical protein